MCPDERKGHVTKEIIHSDNYNNKNNNNKKPQFLPWYSLSIICSLSVTFISADINLYLYITILEGSDHGV